MASWQADTEAAARRAGIDPALYVALIRQESGGRQYSAPGVVLSSPSGALGRAQLLPGTAQGLGVDPRDPQQNLYGGALYLKQQLKAFGGDPAKALAAYNAGPGAVQKYGGVPPYAETQAYVKRILGSLGTSSSSGSAPANSPAAAPAAPIAQANVGDPTAILAALAPGLSGARRQAPPTSTLQAPAFAARPVLAGAVPASSGAPARQPHSDISAVIAAASAQGAAPAGTTSGLIAEASSEPASAPSTASGGAGAALGWAQSKIGFKETGTNSGGLASYLNQRFGLRNAPWCAMFTSAAVTKGGAPEVARTASVADIRAKAQQGVGYEKGFVDPRQARPGDLILFGDAHVGMVQSVSHGRINYVGGNQSDGVTTASTRIGNGDIVRPQYGARR